MSAFRSLFCCAGASSGSADPDKNNTDIEKRDRAGDFTSSSSDLNVNEKLQQQQDDPTAAAPSHAPRSSHNDASLPPPPGSAGHLSVAGPNDRRGSYGRSPSPSGRYIDTQPPAPEKMSRTLSGSSDSGQRSMMSDSGVSSGGATLLPPPSPSTQTRSLELTQHQRMVSNDWGDSLITAIDGAAKPNVDAVKEEDERSMRKPSIAAETPLSPVDSIYSQASALPARPVTPSINVNVPDESAVSPRVPATPPPAENPSSPTEDITKYTRDSVIVVEDSLKDFSWAASARLSVITASGEASGRLSPTLTRTPSTKSLKQIADAFNPTRDPKRASTLSTYSAVIAPAAAAAAVARHNQVDDFASRPVTPAAAILPASANPNRSSATSFISMLNPSYSRPQSPANFKHVRSPSRFSVQSKRTLAETVASPRPFSQLSVAESAYTESVYSERTATPEPSQPTLPLPKSTIPLDEHALVMPHVAVLKDTILPHLDGLLANTSILAHYSIWEKAMGLRREVRAFLSVGIEECVLCDEDGDVETVKMDKMGRVVKGFVERGEEIKKSAERAGMKEGDKGKKEGGMERVRSFWSEMSGNQ